MRTQDECAWGLRSLTSRSLSTTWRGRVTVRLSPLSARKEEISQSEFRNPHFEIPPPSHASSLFRNFTPSPASASWLSASGRQMAAARAMLCTLLVNDSITTGPL